MRVPRKVLIRVIPSSDETPVCVSNSHSEIVMSKLIWRTFFQLLWKASSRRTCKGSPVWGVGSAPVSRHLIVGVDRGPSGNVVLSLHEKHGARFGSGGRLSSPRDHVVGNLRARRPGGGIAIGHRNSVGRRIESDGQDGDDARSRVRVSKRVVERLGKLMSRRLGNSITDHSWCSSSSNIRTSQHDKSTSFQELGRDMRSRESRLEIHLVHLLDGSQKLVRLSLQASSSPTSSRAYHCIVDSA